MDQPGEAVNAVPRDDELRAGFAAFIAASRRLEAGYAELRARAAAVDAELASTNRRLQQALAERDAIFAALPLGVIARRGDGAVAFRNDEARRLCAQAEAAGVDLLSARPGELEVGPGGVRVRCADLPDGELVLLEDRSRIRELEREVHRLDRLAGLSELALGVAHEIKNPLNGAMGFCDLLLRGGAAGDGDAVRRHAERIRRGLAQVDDIVRSLLAFARPEARAQRPAAVAAVAAEAALAVGLPQGRVVVLGDGGLRVEGAALARVFAVLFGNALEARADVSLRIHARANGNRAELVVEDDGPGVPAELGARVFEPFVSSKERGTGLGLPLASRVLSFLGGELQLLNPGERGARFRVRLPLAEATGGAATATVHAAAAAEVSA